MKKLTYRDWGRIKKSIKRLEAKEEEMLRDENPERYDFLKDIEQGDFDDSSFLDTFMRKHNK